MSKLDYAKRVVEAHAGKPRKEMISILITEVGLTAAGASTYYQKLASINKTTTTKTVTTKVVRRTFDDTEVKANMSKIEAEMAEFEKNFRPHKNGLTFVAVD